MSNRVYSLLIFVASLLLLLPFLGAVHLFDWDEINFAECAREMVVSGNYQNLQMNFYPFWEKPPLFIWMQALSMKVFGFNEFAARFPNAVCGAITLTLLFNIGNRVSGRQYGWLWVLCYAGSTLPQFYFHSGIIDPWFNLFIFLSWYCYLRYDHAEIKKISLLLPAAVFAGFALLTKGPAALIILSLSLLVLIAARRLKGMMPVSHFLMMVLVIILVGGLWFLMLVVNGHYDIIENFVSYQYHLFHAEDSGHGGPFYYHFVVLLIGCFPASVFSLKKLIGKQKMDSDFGTSFDRGMKILFWVVLILFSIVQTKIVHYSSLCYFPLTWLAARQLGEWINGDVHLSRWISIAITVIGSILGLALMLLPLAAMNKTALLNTGLIHDENFEANLQANVQWSGWEISIGLFLIVAIVVFNLKRKSSFRSVVIILCLVNMLVTAFAGIVLAPKIEGYTQKAAIDFYESLQQQDCYVESLHYLSYAPYFYGRKFPPDMPEKEVRQWMLKGKIDKPCYFVCKTANSADVLHDYPELREIRSLNGYVFYERLPKD